jgi:peptidoglycan/LPS O-acetylase OafA/YrhL
MPIRPLPGATDSDTPVVPPPAAVAMADLPHRPQLDGLRGLLALGVYVHHGAIWHHYLRSGHWEAPPSRFFANLGQESVLLFFLLSGFLFCERVFAAGRAPLDWRRLYLTRLARLGPLYLVFVGLIAVAVLLLSHGQLRESLPRVAAELAAWTGFAFLMPSINGVRHPELTALAGTAWTLRYEWLFYAALPALALALGARVPVFAFVLAALGLGAMLALPQLEPVYLAGFALGGAVAWLRRQAAGSLALRTRPAAAAAIAALALALGVFDSGRSVGVLLLLTLAFAVVAAGSDGAGLLAARATRRLGTLAYGLYLLHCPLLFLAFALAAHVSEPAHWNAWQHAAFVLALLPVLIGAAALSYRLIEQPAMAAMQRRLRSAAPARLAAAAP